MIVRDINSIEEGESVMRKRKEGEKQKERRDRKKREERRRERKDRKYREREEGQRERKKRGRERERKMAVKIRGSKDDDNNKKLNTSSCRLKIFYLKIVIFPLFLNTEFSSSFFFSFCHRSARRRYVTLPLLFSP